MVAYILNKENPAWITANMMLYWRLDHR
jgi:hypothetical protein